VTAKPIEWFDPLPYEPDRPFPRMWTSKCGRVEATELRKGLFRINGLFVDGVVAVPIRLETFPSLESIARHVTRYCAAQAPSKGGGSKR
jgi:hypothetical protein